MTRSFKVLFIVTTILVFVAFIGASAALVAEICPRAQSGDRRSEQSIESRPGSMTGCSCGQMGRGAGHGRDQAVMQTAMRLVHDYRHFIDRHIVETDTGVVTETRIPSNPEAAEILERHVRAAKTLIESGGRVRHWDPLFSEIFEHSSEISMVIEPIEDGVRVIETSENPQVTKLIQAHAYKVSDFIARGPAAVHEQTPLPEGYRPSETADTRSEDSDPVKDRSRAPSQTTAGCFQFQIHL